MGLRESTTVRLEARTILISMLKRFTILLGDELIIIYISIAYTMLYIINQSELSIIKLLLYYYITIILLYYYYIIIIIIYNEYIAHIEL